MSVNEILTSILVNFDEDLLSYLISVIDDMSIDERKNSSVLKEVVVPYLIDSSYADENEADAICQKISVKFGGSGYKSSAITQEELPILLSAPVKMNDLELIKAPKRTYGGAVLAENHSNLLDAELTSNSSLYIQNIPQTAKEMRRQKKLNNQLQRAAKMENLARAAQAAEMARARMAAIRASRAAGRQASVGLSLDRVNLPHPSGTGDLLSEISLSLTPGRRYGLIGRNGAGKVCVYSFSLAIHALS